MNISDTVDIITAIVSLIAIFISTKQLIIQNTLNKTNIRKEKLKIRHNITQEKISLQKLIQRSAAYNDYRINVEERNKLLKIKSDLEKEYSDFMVYYQTRQDRENLEIIITKITDIYDELNGLANTIGDNAILNITNLYLAIDEEFKKIEIFFNKDLKL